jgi:periplasmic protein TonB
VSVRLGSARDVRSRQRNQGTGTISFPPFRGRSAPSERRVPAAPLFPDLAPRGEEVTQATPRRAVAVVRTGPGSPSGGRIVGSILAHATLLAGLLLFVQSQPNDLLPSGEAELAVVFEPASNPARSAEPPAQAAIPAPEPPPPTTPEKAVSIPAPNPPPEPTATHPPEPPAPEPTQAEAPPVPRPAAPAPVMRSTPQASEQPPVPTPPEPTATQRVEPAPPASPPTPAPPEHVPAPSRPAVRPEVRPVTRPPSVPRPRFPGGSSSAPRFAPVSPAREGPLSPVVPPRPVAGMAADRPPVYPELARRRGEQGRVLVRVSVSATGTPLAVGIGQSSGHASLDDAALAAVRQWRFIPATQAGRPVPAAAVVPIQFQLED